MKKRPSLKTQIIGLLIIVLTVPLTIVTIYNSYSSIKNYKQMYDATTSDNMNRVSENVSNMYKTYVESIEMLSLNSNVKNMKKDEANSGALLLKSLETFGTTHKDACSTYIGLSDGKTLQYPAESIPEGYDPRQRPWYKSAVDSNGKVFLTAPYEDAINKGTMIVTFSKVVKDDSSGEIIGVVAIDIKLNTLSNIVSKIKVGGEGYISLLDSNGQVIAHKDSNMVGKTSKDQSWIKDVIDSSNNGFTEKIGDNNYNITKQVNKDTNWLITGFTSESEISRKVDISIVTSAIIALVCLVAAISLGIFNVSKIIKSINKIIEALNRLKAGDFSQKIEKDVNANLEIEAMEDAANKMIENTIEVITSVIESTNEVRQASESLAAITEESNAVGEEVAKAVQDIAQGATDQASNAEISTKITNELGEEINKSMNEADEMLRASEKVKNSTNDGVIVINNLKEIFEETSNSNKVLVEEVQVLGEKSNKISTITDTIKEITEQTNLLALNASIEAARAGEAGKGFAVVAEEVRKLAEESSEAAAEINKVIQEVKESVNEVNAKITLSTKLNERTKESINLTNNSFENIEKSSNILQNSVEKVTEALIKISRGKDSVVNKIGDVSIVAHETAATAEEVSASSEEQSAGLQEIAASTEKLTALAESLDKAINIFKI